MSCLSEYWGQEFTPQEIADTRARNGLLSLELELSLACNIRCIYCYAGSGLPLADELSLAEIKQVIDQAAELGARKIIVLGGGEPLLYPEIFTVIDYIRGKGLQADIFTNGTLITPEIARRLQERQVAVVVKRNSLQPEVQDLLAGRPGTFAAIEQGLAALQEVGYPADDLLLGVQTIVCRHNYAELPDIWRWARCRGIIPYVEMMTLQGRAVEHPELEVSGPEIRSLFEQLAGIDREEFGFNWSPRPPLAASQCSRHEYSCTVTSLGDVNPCPGVNVGVGNIRQQPLAEILAGSRVIRELRDIRHTIKGKCSGCDHNTTCYGCRGHAYQVTGDYLAEDPLCWLESKG
ncbi:radical SAM/SPASM domain-containing protein [Desulfurivibrio alkaliphilus]|uniref:Radical SAM domain protein n=1 Tax=Desulfurivibrio alkaliphilus (strain DSM 19089 / UNIQEM U267 / AHT2) TaxID=589865 RepID=D6Z2Q3_DESAT|nr:radical SAM protein [Desulfurivibrio alkaliphilus]ADH85828.1 Radical SAM domain protein [Desulfurivibrio alkaliphilus AHT 2]